MVVALIGLASCSDKDKPQSLADSTAIKDSIHRAMTGAPKAGGATESNATESNAADSAILHQLATTNNNTNEIQRLPDNSPEAIPPFPIKPLKPATDSEMRAKIPVGSMPIIQSPRLHALHPALPGYKKDESRVFHRDVPNVISKSVQIYRDLKDTNHTVRFEIIDQNEQAASKMIHEIQSMRDNDNKQVSISPSGEARIAYLTEVNGMIGASCYIESEHVATLALVVGDHRVVFLREQPATDREHLIELVKHFETKKFETMH